MSFAKTPGGIELVEGIFDGSVKTPSSTPASLVEVWCRDPKDPSGIETITHLLQRINDMQNEVNALRNRLRLYESR